MSFIDTAKEIIKNKIAESMGDDFENISSIDLAKQYNPVRSLRGRAVFYSLIREKGKKESDAVKIAMFKEKYAEWIKNNNLPDELSDEYGFFSLISTEEIR